MYGESYSAFNSLRVAYEINPPALRAVFLNCGADDRCTQSIPSRGGRDASRGPVASSRAGPAVSPLVVYIEIYIVFDGGIAAFAVMRLPPTEVAWKHEMTPFPGVEHGPNRTLSGNSLC
jgi:hypothetical protein